MTPSARIQAAIEVLDEVIASVRDDGPPADAIVTRYFKQRRYAGSGDRRAVRELVFRAIRSNSELPATGRAAMLTLPDVRGLFDGSPHGPAAVTDDELAVIPGLTRDLPPLGAGRKADPRFRGDDEFIPQWLNAELSPLVAESEQAALLDRAPVDLRVNISGASRDELLAQFEGAEPTPFSPWGIRLPPGSRIDDHPAYRSGLVEVQDEGSQLIALACGVEDGEHVVDLCAGAGGKSLAIAAAAPDSHILATDSNRSRLSKLTPRADRAGAKIETRLLNQPSELADLEDVRGKADVVLVDAPCSGSGTWRRNPEGRWRLTPERLDRVVALQARLLDLGAELVRPGGRLVYAVCSLLSREGAGQIAGFISRRSSWIVQETPFAAGRLDRAGRLLTPGHDGTDGFFVARLGRPC